MTTATALPVRILDTPPAERVLLVDGAWDADGPNLSHWPGNRTPRHLRHDLSTGAALAFAKLPREERAALLDGCVAIANNHYDTDGTLALFAVTRPDAAVRLERPLLDAAAAGDFFLAPTDHAVAIDALVHAWVDPDQSPIAAELAGLDDRARHQRATESLLAVLGTWLASPLDGEPLGVLEPLWGPAVHAVNTDRLRLRAAERTDRADLHLVAWTLEDLVPDPGRHALFEEARFEAARFEAARFEEARFQEALSDRVLVSKRTDAGHEHRLVVSTRSWFDLDPPGPPRPDLEVIAAALQEREPSPAGRWRCQPSASPSPELWFGDPDVESFAERNRALAPSGLPPEAVLKTLAASHG